MANLWYYGTPEGHRGPVEEEELRRMIAAGQVSGNTLVWRDGMENWQALQYVPGLGQQAASPYLPGNAAAWGGAPGGAYAQPLPSSGLAVASMVCGILVFFTCVSFIPAIICGHMALSRISASPFTVGGRGMAITGLVLGYLALLPCLLFFVSLILNISTNSTHYP